VSPDIPYITTPDGHRRFLACLPPKQVRSFPRFADAHDLIPVTEWQPTKWLDGQVRITDQNGYNACVDFAATGAFEDTWRLCGHTPRRFANFYTYAHINGGIDAGAIISDAIESMMAHGVPEEGLVPAGTIKQKRITEAAHQNAARHRLEKAFALTSFEEIGTALQLGFECIFGISVGARFTNLDAGGVPGIGGFGGHALRSVNLVRVTAGPFQGRWAAATPNSWGTAYGVNGWCNLVEEHFETRWGIDGWAIQAPLEDPQDDTNPPAPRADTTGRSPR
jgi:hypothetical protein